MNFFKKEIKINKKNVIFFVLINIIVLVLHSSYALFQISLIQDNVVVIKGLDINVSLSSDDLTNNKLTLAANERKDIVLTITNQTTIDIIARLYYISATTDISFVGDVNFTDDDDNALGIVEKNSSKNLNIQLKNNTENPVTLELGVVGGLVGYEIEIDSSKSSVKFISKNLNEDLNDTLIERGNPYILEDDIKYISGAKDDNNPETHDDIDFNYVWYSGKLWRITAIYPDGTMKMITDGPISLMTYGTNNKFYTNNETKSNIYQFLNEEFFDTLYNYKKVIVENNSWNVTAGNGTISYKLPETTMVTTNVGLLNSYEYYKSYEKLGAATNGYLNIGTYWWLINPYNSSSANGWDVNKSGAGHNYAPSYGLNIRPVIKLKSTVKIKTGNGSKTNPYVIKGNPGEPILNKTLLNTRISGEYVNVNNQIFRIVGTETVNGQLTTKLSMAETIKDANNADLNKPLASNIYYGNETNTQSDDYWDYYLNNTWLKGFDSTYNETTDTSSILVKNTYYTRAFTSGNYKSAVCETASTTVSIKDCAKISDSIWYGYVGLPRYGEILSAATTAYTWIITPFNNVRVWCMGNDGLSYNGTPSNGAAARPSINVTSEMVIKSGNGTKQDPFVVELPE